MEHRADQIDYKKVYSSRPLQIASSRVTIVSMELPDRPCQNIRTTSPRKALRRPKSNRKVQRDFDKDAYKARHLIENFFCKLKQYRAIATRYDKTARNFLAAIHLAAAVIWLN
jgi:transposase